jgi:glycosyltransferase involved in cell wall biosynthesis
MQQARRKKAMKVLAIAPQPFFSPRGTPFSVYYRTLVKAQMGCSVDLLTYGQGEDVDIPGVRIIRIPDFGMLGSIKIGPSFLKLFLDVFLVLWAVGLLMRNRYDFVHAHEEAVFFCAFLKPVFRYKLIYDMHSSLPQQLDNFKFTTSRIIKGLFEKLEEFSIKQADAVITICPDLANYVTGLILNQKKHFLIENSIFDPVRIVSKSSTARPDEGATSCQQAAAFLQERSCVVYAGTLEPYQGIDLLITSFREVLKNAPQAGLLIAGGSPSQVKEYQGLVDRLGLKEHVLFAGRVSPDTARSFSRSAAVLVSPRSSGTNTPLKIYEQLASGIPLVATNIHSHTQVLSDEIAILVKPEPVALAGGLLEALDPLGRGRSAAEKALRLYEQKYSRSAYEAKMKALLELVS